MADRERPLSLTLRHMKSFRRESGFPYDQWVTVYSAVYRFRKRRLHRTGRHDWRRRGIGDKHCDWCGATGG